MPTLPRQQIATTSGPGPLLRLWRAQRMPILVGAALLLLVVLTAALYGGLRNQAQRRASELFATANTIADFQAILQEVPESYLTFGVHVAIANRHWERGELGEAGAALQKALDIAEHPFQKASALYGLGMLELSGNSPRAAIERFGQAVAADPEGPKAIEALKQWARALERLGRDAEARELLHRAQGLGTQDPGAK